MELSLNRLGERIRYLRQGKGWSLAELSEKSGVSKAYISDLENGSGGNPNIQYLFKIAVALDTTIQALIEKSMPAVQRSAGNQGAADEALPTGLTEFARVEKLKAEEVDMLAKLNFRGHRPKDVESWRFVYEAIRMASRSREP